jgi:hypothetical protein
MEREGTPKGTPGEFMEEWHGCLKKNILGKLFPVNSPLHEAYKVLIESEEWAAMEKMLEEMLGHMGETITKLLTIELQFLCKVSESVDPSEPSQASLLAHKLKIFLKSLLAMMADIHIKDKMPLHILIELIGLAH